MVKLNESLRALFYTPYYLAVSLDTFSAEGIAVELGRPENPAQAADVLFDGTADVTWGGPMRMMQYQSRFGAGAVVGFGEAVTRDPFFLIGRQPISRFSFDALLNVRLATVSEVPTPWMCLQDDVRRAGLDPRAIERKVDGSMRENTEALRAGEVDVIQVFEPFVEELLADGSGHLWYAAANRGPTSYTTFYTSANYARENPRVLQALTNGLYAAQKELHDKDASQIAALVHRYFEEIPKRRLENAIDRYQRLRIWGRNPVLPLEGYVRLKAALISGGFIAQDFPFEQCVDNTFALNATANE